MFAGAAFTDQADISDVNADAVDLLTTLNIIQGDPDGSFAPEREVTRAEMAKMIYTIRNGGNDNADAYETVTTSFTDINGHWAEGYIKYLQNTGIVAGKSATEFDPDSTVTTGEAMKMALVLGGYRADKAELTGTNWLKNTVTLATTNGLTDDVTSAIAGGCTRQDAAQILANALDMTAVQWSEFVDGFVNDSEDGLAIGGAAISVGRKWMDLYTNIGTLVAIDGSDLDIQMSTSDEVDSDTADKHFINVGTDYSSLLGQKVKVLFENGKNNSVIGLFAIDDNNLVVVNQNVIGVDAGKLVIDGTSYAIETDGVTVIKDGEELAENWKAGAFKDEQSADVISLIDTDDNNKVDTAYIKTVDVEKVTYVASSQIIAGSKTYKFADDSIDENVAKDDWVMITKNLYNDNNDIVVVDKATGAVQATKSGSYTKYQIDDTWYNETDSSSKDINSNVKPGVDAEYVAVNGILFYAAKTSTGADQLTDVLFVAFVGKDGLSNDQARVMFPNGDKATINLKNSYSTKQDGTKGATIADGQFYEYSKSGSTYELIDLSNDEDFYGNFTYEGTGDLSNTAEQVESDKIADSADVIVWTTDGVDKVDFKHITGKQLKALVEGGMKVDGSTDNLVKTTLGYFTSDVDGLNRASVLAVKYNGNGTLGTDFDDISSNANYGFITKDAEKLANGTIRFTVWTGTDNVEVIAEKSNEKQFTKGTIVGYTAIIENEDGTKTMTDAVAIRTSAPLVRALSASDGVYVGSITAVNTAGTKIETDIPGAAEDLSDYSTVLYVDSKAGTGIVDGKPTVANSKKVNGTTYYAANVLVYGTELIVIDVNEIAGSTYGAYTLQDTISGLTDVQWINTRTNDTDEGNAYYGAIMQLSFYAETAGTLTLNGVVDIESNDDDGTVVLDYEAGYNKFDSLIVTDDVTASINGSGSTTTSGNATVTNNLPTGTTATVSKPSAVTGNVDIMIKVPDYVPNGATVKFDYVLSGDGATLAAASASLTVANGYAKVTPSVDVSGYDKLSVTLNPTSGADFTNKVKVTVVDQTGKVTVTNDSNTSTELTTGSAADLKIKAQAVSGLVEAGAKVTVSGLATAANNKEYTLTAAELWTAGAAGSGKTLVNDKAAGDQAVVITITELTDTVGSNTVTVTGLPSGYTAEPLEVSQAGENKDIVINAPTWVTKAKVQYRIGNTGSYTTTAELTASSNQLTISSVAFAAGTSDIEVQVSAIEVTETTLAFEMADGVAADSTVITGIDINSKAALTVAGESVAFQASGNNTKKAKITFKVENIEVTTSAQCVANEDGTYTLTWTGNADTNTQQTVTLNATGNGAAKIVVTAISYTD